MTPIRQEATSVGGSEAAPRAFARGAARRLTHRANLEKVFLVGLALAAPLLVFYNLQYAPRTWHDEGAAMSVARTLVEDGVYAVRASDGYQTFGPIQSVGPTVLLPVALSFRLFGIGLVQGRLVMAFFTLATLATLYAVGLRLFDRPTALLAVALLLGSPAARFLWFGRQVLGEVPALGFFLGGWLAWLQGVRSGRRWLNGLAGLLIGAAMITKSSYILIGFGTLALLALLDVTYYRQRNLREVVAIGLVALACVAAWWGWQIFYFGMDTFRQNSEAMRRLGSSTTGLDAHLLFTALKFLLGADAGYFYFFWGIPALLYAGLWSLRREREGFLLAALLIFTLLWLGYYLWSVPWLSYLFVPGAVSALFVAKLGRDLLGGVGVPRPLLWSEVRQGRPGKAVLSLMALLGLGLMIGAPLLAVVRVHVWARDEGPQRVAAFLSETVHDGAVIETWERELAILTDHTYHFPEQRLLVEAHAALYRGGNRDYRLGAAYFQKHRPSFVVVGWFARWLEIYDADFLAAHADLLTTIGEGDLRYEVYRLHGP
jgi:4-amino-4-deoxy-L-arabinose transferase-like glycosyltransferase